MKFSATIIFALLLNMSLVNQIYSQSWISVPVSGNIQKIAFNQQIGIAVGDNGVILKTTDGGLSFTQIVSGINDNLVDVKYVGNNSFIACGWIWGTHGVVIKSTDNGSTWNSVISLNGQFNEMFGVYDYNSDTIFVSGTNQLIKTYNGFTSYSTSNFPNGYQYRSLFFNNNLILMAHAGTITMRKSNNFGVSYTNCATQPISNMLRDMVYHNNQLFAIGDNGTYCTSSDGDNWNMIPIQNLNFKSIHDLAGVMYTCTTSDVYELSQNGNLISIYNSNSINSTGKSLNKLFALGNNFIAYKINCTNNTTITPQTNSIATGSMASFTASTSDPNPSYVWQSNFGQGFQTLNNFGNYSGVNTATLNIANVQLSEHNQPIRVITTSGNCIDTSNVGVINILDTCITSVTVYDTLLTTVTDTLVINTQITGINPPNNLNTLKVFPNPASTHITIDYGNFSAMSGYTLTIVNSIGQTVFTTPINQQTSYIALSTWTGNGIYFVQLIDPQNNTIENRKIVIQ